MQAASFMRVLHVVGGGVRLGSQPTPQGPAKWTAALGSADCNFQSRAPTALTSGQLLGRRQPAWLAHRARLWSSTGGRGGGLPGSLLSCWSHSPHSPERLQPERQPPGQQLHVRNGGASAQVPHTSWLPPVQHQVDVHDPLW